jgi:hypothetical protein
MNSMSEGVVAVVISVIIYTINGGDVAVVISSCIV